MFCCFCSGCRELECCRHGRPSRSIQSHAPVQTTWFRFFPSSSCPPTFVGYARQTRNEVEKKTNPSNLQRYKANVNGNFRHMGARGGSTWAKVEISIRNLSLSLDSTPETKSPVKESPRRPLISPPLSQEVPKGHHGVALARRVGLCFRIGGDRHCIAALLGAFRRLDHLSSVLVAALGFFLVSWWL